jgi:molybdate transport system permease protein
MDSDEWQIIRFTLGVSALATGLSVPVGIAVAWLLARKNWIGKSVVETLIALPLVMPPVATGLILLKLFGRRGPVGSFLEDRLGLEIVFTWKAVLIALAVMSFPLLVRTMRLGFEQVPVRFEQVARTLGAGPLRVFFEITLPLAGRGVLAGVILGFARCLGEFGATIMVAGAIPGATATIPVSIFQQIQLGQDAPALRLLAVSIVLSFLSLWVGELLMRGRRT